LNNKIILLFILWVSARHSD